MSDAIFRGKLGAVQTTEEITFSQQTGRSGRFTLKGSVAAIKALLGEIEAKGWNYTYRSQESPLADVVYETPGVVDQSQPEIPQTIWEYLATTHEIDILEADVAAVAGISDEDKRKIRAAIQNPDPDGPSPAVGPDAGDIYSLMLGGVRNWRVDVTTLRVSRIVSNTYAVQASQANVRRILSTGTLINQEAPPTRLFTLPVFTPAKAGFVYGWYKRFPNIQVTNGNRFTVSQEWEFGLYPTKLYGALL